MSQATAWAALPSASPQDRRDAEDRIGVDARESLANAEWPSARVILQAQRESRGRSEPSKSSGRRPLARPLPTIGVEPRSWRVPLWLGWPPALALAVLSAAVGLALAWTWSWDAYAAGQVANALATGDLRKANPTLDAWDVSDPTWWKTTARHLLFWSVYRDQTGSGSDDAEQVQSLLDAARRASPLEPGLRYATARMSGSQVEGNRSILFQNLGLSRDVIALAWTGRQLLRSGKPDEAIQAYHKALVMASRAGLSHEAPTFNDDPQVRRYSLPGEGLIVSVIRDMAVQDQWSYEQWSTALPPTALVRLATARVFREQGGPNPEKPLDDVIDMAEDGLEAGGPVAVHLAARAEAFALRSRWEDAESHYRRAVAMIPEGVIRRSWCLNLAEIDARLNRESDRQKDLEAAKGSDPRDEVSRRAANLQRPAGGGFAEPRFQVSESEDLPAKSHPWPDESR